jgi:hypothetical protein
MLIKWFNTNKWNALLILFLLAVSMSAGRLAASRPNEFFVLAAGITSAVAVITCSRIVPSHIADPVDKAIFIWSCAGGVTLNTLVRVANSGYMPVLSINTIDRYWMPMSNANLSLLGDWLVGDYSIGDILIISGLFWVIYCGLRWRMKTAKYSQLTVYTPDPAED